MAVSCRNGILPQRQDLPRLLLLPGDRPPVAG